MKEYHILALRTCVKYLHKEMNPTSDVMSYKFQQPITFFIFRILKKSQRRYLYFASHSRYSV